jgi:hypothetical protein
MEEPGAAMSPLPKVKLANSDIELTRMICGGNPLVGYSHFSSELDAEMSEYCTVERVVKFVHQVQAEGMNAVQFRGDYHRVLHWLELFKREGGKLRWIAQTASEMANVFDNIRVIAAAGAKAIYHHGTRTDKFWLEGNIDKTVDFLKCMRDTGVQVGLASHIPEVIEYAEEHDWDLDFYMCCFYNINRRPRESAIVSPQAAATNEEEFLPEDPPRMCQVIRATDKMCLAFKILGAGRRCETQDDVRSAFRFAFDNIKPKDAVVVGMYPKYEEQISLNVGHVLAACGQNE